MREEWRQIRDHELYSVSNQGRVRNESTGRILKPYPNREGKLQVRLRNAHGSVDHMVHRLVAAHFLDHDTSRQVRHISEDFTDNSVGNLESARQYASPRIRGYRQNGYRG